MTGGISSTHIQNALMEEDMVLQQIRTGIM